MHGPSHLLISWYVADSINIDSVKNRKIIAWSGFAPDIDVIGYILAIIYYGFDMEMAFKHFWQPYHHVYTHGLTFILLTGIVTYFLTRTPKSSFNLTNLKIPIICMLVSALHNLCDLIAGGSNWPIYPLYPIHDYALSVSWSIPLSDWRNALILIVCLSVVFIYAKTKKYSPMEVFGKRFENWFMVVVKFGTDNSEKQPNGTKKRFMIYTLLVFIILFVLYPIRDYII